MSQIKFTIPWIRPGVLTYRNRICDITKSNFIQNTRNLWHHKTILWYYNLEFVISRNWFSISHNSWQLRFYLNIMQNYIIFISFESRQKSLTPRMKLIDGTKWDSKICTFAWTYLSVSKNSVSLSTSNKQITCTYVSCRFFLEIVKVKLSTEHHHTIWIDRLLCFQ